MFALWYAFLGLKEYNPSFTKPPSSDTQPNNEPTKKPDLIPEKKDPNINKKPAEPEKPKSTPPEPPKTPLTPTKPSEPTFPTGPPKTPAIPIPSKSPESPKIPEPAPKLPDPPKTPEPPKPSTPKTPEPPKSNPTPKKPESARVSTPPRPSTRDDEVLGKTFNNFGNRDVNGAGGRKSPRDLSYTKMVESPDNLPDRNFHVTEAKIQEKLSKTPRYVEQTVISNPDSLESSEAED